MGKLDLRVFSHPSLGGDFNSKRPDVKVRDNSDTSLPSGSAPTIDGVPLQNGDRVLFSNLSSNNNRVFKLQGAGSASGISWLPQLDEPSSDGSPQIGDLLLVQQGSTYAGQLLGWNGSAWINLNPDMSGQSVAGIQFTAPASATTPGSVVKKIQIFDASGNSIGFLPVYSSIT